MYCLRFFTLAALWLSAGLCTLHAQSNTLPVAAAVQQFGDAGGRFEAVGFFSPAATRSETASRFAPSAQFLSLDVAQSANRNATLPSALTLQIPYHDQMLTLDLLETPVFTADFSVVTSLSDGQAVDYLPARHYRGAIRGDNHSMAAFSFCSGEIMGLIADDHYGNLVLGRLDRPGNTKDYILYSDQDLTDRNQFSCTALDTGVPGPKPSAAHPEVSGCVRAYWECDYELFQNKGSVQATVDYLAGAFNQLATLYANEQINTMLSEIFVWVTSDNYSVSSSSTALNQFKTLRKSYNGDIAHLVGIGGNNLGGIAYVGALCLPSYAYAFSDINTSYATVPTYSWTVEVLTHEMGHNLGSPHTQSCTWPGGAIDNCFTTEGGCPPGPAPVNGGTIMSYCHLTNYGINFNNGFGPLPGNKIRASVSAASCLPGACAPLNNCPAPGNITVTNITGNSAVVSWTGTGNASSYTVQWRAVGAPAWAAANNATSPYTITSLPVNDEIEVRLQSNCGSTVSEFSLGVIFITGSSGGGGGGTSCGTPANLSATATTSASAVISWGSVSGANSYQLSYKTASASLWSTPINLLTTTYTLSALAAGTTYNVRVAAACSGTTSGYASSSFTTPGAGGGSACGIPGNLSASANSVSTATVSWSPVSGAIYYQLYYKQSSASFWSGAINISNTTYALNGLTASTAYDVRVRAICSSGNSSSATTTFSTPGSGGGGTGTTCPTPANFTLNYVAATSAIISWSSVAGATGYDLQIKPVASNNWITFLNLPATVVQITHLQPNSTYQVRVRTRCSGSNNFSNYTDILNINTPAYLNAYDATPEPLPAGSGVSVLFPAAGAETTEGPALQIFPNPTSSRVQVWFEPAAADGFTGIGLYDLNGRSIDLQPVSQEASWAEFNLSTLPAGVYFVRATAKNQAPMVKRLVKE